MRFCYDYFLVPCKQKQVLLFRPVFTLRFSSSSPGSAITRSPRGRAGTTATGGSWTTTTRRSSCTRATTGSQRRWGKLLRDTLYFTQVRQNECVHPFSFLSHFILNTHCHLLRQARGFAKKLEQLFLDECLVFVFNNIYIISGP